MKAMKKAVTSTMCPKIFRSESENFVIKVTINNRSGELRVLIINLKYRNDDF